MSNDAIKALHLLSANAHWYSVAANACINANVKTLLANGLIDYAPGRRCGYKITPAGLRALNNG